MTRTKSVHGRAQRREKLGDRSKARPPRLAADQDTTAAQPSAAELIEVASGELGSDESVETDEAPDRVDHDLVEERTATPDSCSLPDEERSAASDIA